MPVPIHNAQPTLDEPLTSKRATASAARALINDIMSSDENLDNSDNDPDYVDEKARDSSSNDDADVNEFLFVRDFTDYSQRSHSFSTRTEEHGNIHSEQSEANLDDDGKQKPDGENESTVTRKRHSNPNNWKKNVRKSKRAKGLEYTDTTGKQRQERKPRASGCEIKNCRYKCHEHFSEQDRNDICTQYWSLADFSRQKDYLLATTKTIQIQRRRSRQENPKNRENTVHYYFNIGAANFRVCKDFYLRTLDISAGPLKTAMNQRSETNTFKGEDMRGKHEPHNKTSNEDVAYAKQHIETFPQMEAHYVRSSSKRKYLDQTLSISKMFDLYKSMCQQDGRQPISQMTYRRIFCDNYNLAFFRPKKDQCAHCARWKTLSPQEKVDEKMEYEAHLKRHEEAQTAKKQDKIKASNDPNFVSVSFDLQSVLQLPSNSVSLTYYSRKLCVYNLCIFDQSAPHEAFCYTWNECEGKRGGNEIASCLYEWFQRLPSNVKSVSLFSDTCSGQNRNKNVAAMFLYVVQNTHVETICHNFLESGHSYLECDSMHSAIEREKRFTPVSSMLDWVSIFTRSRRKQPYKVKVLEHTDILDFGSRAQSTMRNLNRSTEGDKINWLLIKVMRYNKSKLGIIEYKYNYQEDFKQMDVRGKERRSTDNAMSSSIPRAYAARLPISEAKKKDLLSLCKKCVIPKELHHWYNELPSSHFMRDALPEPDLNEEDTQEK